MRIINELSRAVRRVTADIWRIVCPWSSAFVELSNHTDKRICDSNCNSFHSNELALRCNVKKYLDDASLSTATESTSSPVSFNSEDDSCSDYQSNDQSVSFSQQEQTHNNIRIRQIDSNDTTGNRIVISHADDETVWYYSDGLFPARPIWRHNNKRQFRRRRRSHIPHNIILSNECIQTNKLNKYGVPDDEFELWKNRMNTLGRKRNETRL